MQSHPVDSDDESEKEDSLHDDDSADESGDDVHCESDADDVSSHDGDSDGILHIMSSQILIGLTLVAVKILLIMNRVLLTQHRLVQLIWKLVVQLMI